MSEEQKTDFRKHRTEIESARFVRHKVEIGANPNTVEPKVDKNFDSAGNEIPANFCVTC